MLNSNLFITNQKIKLISRKIIFYKKNIIKTSSIMYMYIKKIFYVLKIIFNDNSIYITCSI